MVIYKKYTLKNLQKNMVLYKNTQSSIHPGTTPDYQSQDKGQSYALILNTDAVVNSPSNNAF